MLALVDGTADVTAEDAEILRLAAKCPNWILIRSKCDLWDKRASSLGVVGKGNLPAAEIALSSVTGEGLEELEAAVAAIFPAGEVPAGQILTNARQAEAVGRAAEAVSRARGALESGLTPDAILTDGEDALNALGELTGRTLREDLVGRIFERFCVGK